MRVDYPLGALKRRWLRSVVLRSPLGPWYALTGPGGHPVPKSAPLRSLLLATELAVDGQGARDLVLRGVRDVPDGCLRYAVGSVEHHR